MRFLLSLIGYAAVATVLSTAIGVGYLWQTERLTDERLFRIVALLHGVEIKEDLDDESLVSEAVPNEEPSLDEERRLREIALRNHEARTASLERGRKEFDHSLSLLLAQRDRIDQLASELKQRLEEVNAETADEGVDAVVRDLKVAKPTKGKELLLRMLERGGSDPDSKQRALDDVVQLINAMPPDTWMDILNRFEGEKELDQLHRIQVEQLQGGAKQRVLEEAMDQLGLGNSET